MRIAADGFAERVLNRGSERFGESLRVALLAALLDCFGDDGAYVFDAASGVVEALLNFLKAFLLGADDEMAQLFVGWLSGESPSRAELSTGGFSVAWSGEARRWACSAMLEGCSF